MPRHDRTLDALDLKLLQALELDESWIVRLGCTPAVATRLALALARRPDTQYVDLVSGGTEVLCLMKPRTRRERDDLLLERIQRTPRVTSVSAHCILHSFYGGPVSWLRKTSALDQDEEAALRTPAPTPMSGLVTLDAVDETLLAALRRDGRATLAELQSATGHPEVRFAGAITGPTNLTVSVLCRTTEHLYAYLSERVGGLAGVHTADTALILRRVKTLTFQGHSVSSAAS